MVDIVLVEPEIPNNTGAIGAYLCLHGFAAAPDQTARV